MLVMISCRFLAFCRVCVKMMVWPSFSQLGKIMSLSTAFLSSFVWQLHSRSSHSRVQDAITGQQHKWFHVCNE